MAERQDQLEGVDRAALVFAATAAGITLATTDGAWTGYSTFVGCVLVILVLAIHRPAPGVRTLRSFMIRGAFGGTIGLCLYVVLGWPLQGTPLYLTEMPPWLGFGVMLALGSAAAWIEPAISRIMDRPF